MRRILSALIIAGAGLALAAPAAAAPIETHALTPMAPTRPAAQVQEVEPGSVEDFTFSRFDADYYLGVDDDGRAVLRSVLTYVAEFPETDQNRGIRLAIPERYQGRPVDLVVDSVKDGEGAPRSFEEDSEDDLRLVTIAADDYVHGEQTYVVRTTQHNVILDRDDGEAQEFYWDLNGTGFAQPFDRVSARIRVSDAVANRLTGESACYRGAQDSRERCPVSSNPEPDGVVFSVDEAGLEPRQTVTVAIGFQPETFVPRDDSLAGTPFTIPLLASLAAALAALVLAIRARRGPLRDAAGRPTVIAEYTPPPGVTPFQVAIFRGKPQTALAAQILDLAVAGIVRVTESGSEKKPEYSVEVVSATAGTPEQRRMFSRLFGGEPQPGERHDVSGDKKLLKRAGKLLAKKEFTPSGAGWRDASRARASILPFALAAAAATAGLVFAVLMLVDARGGAVPVVVMVLGFLALVAVIVLCAKVPLTSAGAELRDHLAGLELYIRMAEQDRIRVLQSPQGAERRDVASPVAADGSVDRVQALRLTERLLPYAVVFGQEKEWAKELGELYAGEEPGWYSGTTPGFNAALFASSIGSMSTSVTSGFSSSISSSSSSGGSSGGGSAGGGGGGGGGGGV